MTREIDPEAIKNGTLTEEEVIYLRDRGRLPADYDDSEVGSVEPQPPDTAEDMVIQQYQTETKYTPLEDQDSPTIQARGGIVGDEEEEDYLEGWNNDSRRAELSKRGLSLDGNKDEMVARLRRSDTDELLDEDMN
jgi:hypothetical protein